MSGPWPVILAVVAMTAVVYFVARAFDRPRQTTTLRCPRREGEDVVVTFECKLDPVWNPGRRLDVVRCSAFADPAQVACAKECLAHPA